VETLSRFDTVTYGGVDFVIVESHLLPPSLAVIAIPMVPDYPVIRGLNPTILHDGRRLVLATRLIGPVRRASVRRTGSVADQADRITRAIDVLMEGF
jgi:toxin CcdB